ncbi:MAG: VWA domain-containing protein [bacterium]
MFRFAYEQFLYLLILIPLLVLFFVWAFRQKRKAMALFGNALLMQKLSQSVSRKRQVWKVILLVMAFIFLVLSFSRPQLGTKLRTVQREGQDIMIALDVSLSMMAEDIKPNRLEKAKHEIGSLIDKLEGDRIGLIAFAGKAFIQCPLTLDYGAARMFLNVMEPDLIPVPGTAVGEAIQKAVSSFVEKERKHKVLILITDGEDHVGKPVETAQAASKEGVVIYCVGIGSSQGVPIPLIDERGNRVGFKKDRDGEVVMTKLDELTLEKIALETGGKYYRASPGEVELDKIYEDIGKMEKKALASQQFAQFEDRFQALVGLALFLLVLEVALPERRRVKKEWKGRFE